MGMTQNHQPYSWLIYKQGSFLDILGTIILIFCQAFASTMWRSGASLRRSFGSCNVENSDDRADMGDARKLHPKCHL